MQEIHLVIYFILFSTEDLIVVLGIVLCLFVITHQLTFDPSTTWAPFICISNKTTTQKGILGGCNSIQCESIWMELILNEKLHSGREAKMRVNREESNLHT